VAESICVHSDTPGAVAVARRVFEVLQPHLGGRVGSSA
jgi:lactam utilization protein B